MNSDAAAHGSRAATLRPAGGAAATSGSATGAASQQPQPVFPARRQELGQQRGGRGQGWRLRHPERSGGLGLASMSRATRYTFIPPGRAGVFWLLGAPGGSGSAGTARSARKPHAFRG